MSHVDSNDPAALELLGKTAQNRKVSQITGYQVQVLLHKLNVIIPILFPQPIEVQELIHPNDDDNKNGNNLDVNSYYLPNEYQPSSSTGKHVLQEVSILRHLQRINAFQRKKDQDGRRNRMVAIELGCGTGTVIRSITTYNECHDGSYIN